MVKTSAAPAIRGKNIYLRPFTVNDIHDAYLGWLNDDEVNQYSQRRGRRSSREDAVKFISGLSQDDLLLGIYLNGGDKHIGNIQSTTVNAASGVAELRIMVGDKSTWGKGYGSEAIYLLTKYLFNEKKMRRLEANTFNPAFSKCMSKLGWPVEGTQRQRFNFDGQFLDFTWFGLLKSEFKPIAKYE